MIIPIRLKDGVNNDSVLLNLNGYIAQLAMNPLTKKMDEFLEKMKIVLARKYDYKFEYENLTSFIPKYKLTINDTDKKVFLVIIIVTFITTVLGELIGIGTEVFISSVVLSLAYPLGKKYLDKLISKSDEGREDLGL